MRSLPNLAPSVQLLTMVMASATLPACVADARDEGANAGEEDEALTIGGFDPGAIGGIGRGNRGGIVESPGLVDREFYLRSLGSRCWDFGGAAFWAPGAPVFVYSCNGTVAQRIRIVEVDAASHDVELRVPGTPYCIGVRDGVAVGHPLELQVCSELAPPTRAGAGPAPTASAQRFALDGDSVLVGVQRGGFVRRDFVIETRNDATENRTPLVVGERDTSDAEYFTADAVDGSRSVPTSGFVRVGVYHGRDVCRQHQPAQRRCVPPDHWLDVVLRTRGWGTVIEIDDREEFPITETRNLPAGSTLRGSRKRQSEGPTIRYWGFDGAAFRIDQDRVRVTGLRFVGPGTNAGASGALQLISDRLDETQQHTQRILVDHVEITSWTGAAVAVTGDDENPDQANPNEPQAFCDETPRWAYPRTPHVRVLRSYIHDDSRTSGGYGVGIGSGAFVLVQGMVEHKNQHSVTGDPWRRTGYAAYDNLVLSPTFGSGHDSNQDFDVHGSGGAKDKTFSGGIAGDYVDVGWNTFLDVSHFNFKQRGTPCRFALFHDNIAAQFFHDAFTSQTQQALLFAPPADPPPVDRATYVWGNRVHVQTPLDELAVGDFDGDHVDDLFVGTGVTWWFSSGGRTEWRLLNRMPDKAKSLRFGDFDGDGRTDVLAVHDGQIDVSWAGISPWENVNGVRGTVRDLAVGDFDGDGAADLFFADGREWFIAPGARAWQPPFAASSHRTWELRFGDFTADGRTDVLGVVDGQWQLVRAGTETWWPLRSALTSNLDHTVVADFDGDGVADVARSDDGDWVVSYGGATRFFRMRSNGFALDQLPVGNFDGRGGVDVLIPTIVNKFVLAPGPRDPIAAHSLHPMW